MPEIMNQALVIAAVVALAALVLGLLIANVLYGTSVYTLNIFAKSLNMTEDQLTLIPVSNVKGVLGAGYTTLAISYIGGAIAVLIYYLFKAIASAQEAAPAT